MTTVEVIPREAVELIEQTRTMAPAHLVAQSQGELQAAAGVVIHSAVEAQRINDEALRVRAMRLGYESIYGPIRERAHREHADICAAARALQQPLEQAERLYNAAILAWNDVVTQRRLAIAAAEAVREHEEAAVVEQARAAEFVGLAAEAEAAGDPVAAAELRAISSEPAVTPKAPPAARASTAAASLRTIAPDATLTKSWKVDRDGVMRPGTSEVRPDVIRAIVALVEKVPLFADLLTIDFEVADAWAKRLGHDDGTTEFPQALQEAGLRAVHVSGLARKKGRKG